MPQTYTPIVPWGIDYQTHFSPTLRLKTFGLPISILFLYHPMLCRIWATQSLHTSLIHRFLCFTTEEIMVFRRSGFSTTWSTLTPIQQPLLTTASIVLPTRTLPLLAIAKAPQLRFGVPPSPPYKSPCTIQRLSASILASFDLTYLSRLSLLVQ